MADPAFNLWLKHSHNSQAIEYTLTLVSRFTKDSLRTGDDRSHAMGARLATVMLAAYMESRLNEIVWHYAAVPEKMKTQLAQLSIENRWRELVRWGFAERRSLNARDVPQALEFTDRARYDKILSIIDTRVVQLVQARNVLAHGQWLYAFRSDGFGVDQIRMQMLSQFSLWRVTLERNLLTHLANVVYDLVVTRTAYERDFDMHIRNLEAANGRIKRGNRKEWEDSIINRYRRRPTR